jgi:diadenylate cyclase
MWLRSLDWFWLIGLIEILILAAAYYSVYHFFRGTRSVQVLTGLILVLLFLFLGTHVLHLDVLNWILSRLSVYLAIAVLIIFHPEIRGALAELGRAHVFSATNTQQATIDQLVMAVSLLAQRRIGALIAIEREIGTRAVQETGVKLDSKVVADLIASIFFPPGPLHDGGVIISGDKIVAASCLFPLSQRAGLDKSLGTRHRAALGLAEETDAVIIVVSEETGTLSIGYRGRLSRDVEPERLRRFLRRVFMPGTKNSRWKRAKQQLELTPEYIARSETMANKEMENGLEP